MVKLRASEASLLINDFSGSQKFPLQWIHTNAREVNRVCIIHEHVWTNENAIHSTKAIWMSAVLFRTVAHNVPFVPKMLEMVECFGKVNF